MKIVFDVDGTLFDDKNQPRYDVIDLFRMFQSLGWEMYIHSGGGKDYARMAQNRLGLKAEFRVKGEEKEMYDIAVDDRGYANAKVCIYVGNS